MRRMVVALLATSVLLVAGCGDDDDVAADDPEAEVITGTPTDTETETVTGTETEDVTATTADPAVAGDVSGQGERQPDVVVVDGRTVGDLGEMTVDVLGYPDDAQLGERLRIFAEPDAGGESFTVRAVESTTLCRRSVSDGLCV